MCNIKSLWYLCVRSLLLCFRFDILNEPNCDQPAPSEETEKKREILLHITVFYIYSVLLSSKNFISPMEKLTFVIVLLVQQEENQTMCKRSLVKEK